MRYEIREVNGKMECGNFEPNGDWLWNFNVVPGQEQHAENVCGYLNDRQEREEAA